VAVAARDDRIVVTKDADVVASLRLTGQPRRLLLVATGNIANAALDALILAALPELLEAFAALLVIHP